MKEKTIFEMIVDREIPARIIYEDEKHLAFLDVTPFEKGHTLVIPKYPYITIDEMSENEYLALQTVVHKVAKKIRKQTSCGLNVHQNNLPIAHQVVPHVHFHLIPRCEKKDAYRNDNHTKYENDEEADRFLELLKIG